MDYFNFKVSVKNTQKENKLDDKSIESNAHIDTIKKFLRPSHFNILKDYIVKTIVGCVEETELNELHIKPATTAIKTEFVPEGINFVDPNLIVKVEKKEPEEEEMLLGEDRDYYFETTESSPLMKSENSDADDEDDSDSFENEVTGNEEIFVPQTKMEENLTKTVVDNVEFISRVPDCLVDLEKKLQEQKEKQIIPRKQADPKNWQRIKQREARIKGESYISKQGKFIRARTLQKPCKDCRFECTKKISLSDRRKNFENHWGLADFALQKKFLFEHRKVEPVARRRKRKNDNAETKPRTYSTKYYLDTFNKDGTLKSQEKVCETMFCATFDICKNNLRYLHKKAQTGKVQDMRGQNRRKQTEGHLIAIEYVKQFPHFHIEKQKTIRQLYKDYLEVVHEKGVDPVSENTFRTVFSSYNESAFLKEERGVVKCQICSSYYRATEQQKAAMQQDFDEHLRTTTDCRNKFRWRKNGQLKKERRRLLREQKRLEQQLQQHQMLDKNC